MASKIHNALSERSPPEILSVREDLQETAPASKFMAFVVATALRSLNRCLQLLRELPQDQPANLVLARELKSAALARELQELLGLWRLLQPILNATTYRASNRRLKFLLSALAGSNKGLWIDRLASHPRPDKTKYRRAIERLAQAFQAEQHLAPAVQNLGAFAAALTVADLTVMLEGESQAWRNVPITTLAQELVIDRGFARTYLRGQRRLQGLDDAADLATLKQLDGLHRWVLCFASQLKLLGRGQDDERQRDFWYAQHLAECLDETIALLRVLDSPQFAALSPKKAKRGERVISARLDRLVERRQLLGAKAYRRSDAELRYDVARDIQRLQSQNALNMLLLE